MITFSDSFILILAILMPMCTNIHLTASQESEHNFQVFQPFMSLQKSAFEQTC